MRYPKLIWTILLGLTIACFSIELDVSKDGKVLIPRQEGFFSLDPATGQVVKLYVPKQGKPVFGRFSPDGKSILAVVNQDGNFSYRLVDLKKQTEREVFKSSYGLYTRFSPNGKMIAVTRVSSESRKPFNENLPDLFLIATEKAASQTAAMNTSSQFRWLPNSKGILTFIIEKKDQSRYHGQLFLIDSKNLKKKSIASIIGSKNLYFDLSPDGKTILVTAYAADKPNTVITLPKDPKIKLFQLHIKKGLLKTLEKEAEFMIFSPNGKMVLLGGPEKSGKRTLELMDTKKAQFSPLVTDAAAKIGGGMGSDATIYPGWLNNKEIFYLGSKAVYGTAGVNLEFFTIGVEGKNRKGLQTIIDTAVEKN